MCSQKRRWWIERRNGELKDKILASELTRVKLFGDGQISTIPNPKNLNKKMIWAQGLGQG